MSRGAAAAPALYENRDLFIFLRRKAVSRCLWPATNEKQTDN